MRGWLAAFLPRIWLQRGPAARLLWPLSLVFGWVAAGRRRLFRCGVLATTRLPVPVVVVGNVVAGGSGKTPIVMGLVEHLRACGWQVGVIARGHGRSTTDCREVLPSSLAHEVGDEPLLVRRVCGVPVFVAARRAEAGLALLARHPATQIVLCDDGLQHLALARDVEICVFDDRGIGNGWLLPAGPLREHWPRRADLVVHTGDRPAFDGFRARRRLSPLAQQADGTQVALASWVDTPVLALAGIARPQRFFDMLRAAGLRHVQELPLPDHFDFAEWQPPEPAPAVWLCTEKDAVKLWAQHPRVWAVPLELTLDEALLRALDRKLGSPAPPPAGPQVP